MTLLIKTYLGDLKRAINLLRSLNDTETKLDVTVVAEKDCLSRLKDLNLGLPKIEYLHDRELLNSAEQRLPGYLQQQIIKLRFTKSAKFLIIFAWTVMRLCTTPLQTMTLLFYT